MPRALRPLVRLTALIRLRGGEGGSKLSRVGLYTSARSAQAQNRLRAARIGASLGATMALGAGFATGHVANAEGKLMSFGSLKAQDSVMSSAIIAMFKNDPKFIEVSKKATQAILQRDEEDGVKLQQGIDLAIGKGVIPAKIHVEPVCKIDVTGKSADVVAQEIITGLGEAASKGCVMTLQGLSGTGKGTTVATLKQKLPQTTTWSNGNIFRSLTLLAATYAEQNNVSLKDACSPKLLASYCKMLTFGKYNGKFDVKIDGLGYDLLVSEVANTVLKGPKVGKNIPTVAGVTQGEVINFVQSALKIMADDGMTVLLEGREQTLNYIRTPHRFELVLADVNTIGMRRAAQRMGATALKELEKEQTWYSGLFGGPSQKDIASKLSKVLDDMSKE